MAKLPYFQVEVGAAQQRFEMPEGKTEVIVGRATDCQWIIASGAVSRRHARLVRHGSGVTIEDLGSSNGTFVNGEPLSAPHELHDQDRVQLGAVEILFVSPPDEPSADETIALSAMPSLAPVKAPPVARSAETRATSEPSGSTARTELPPPPAAPSVEELAPKPPVMTAPREVPPLPEPTAATAPLPAPEPPSAPAPAPSAGPSDGSAMPMAAEGSQPTIAELAIIAAGSFLVVFAVGALLIRFVF
jgi:predicted component of type VI protein secretion system